MIIHSNYSLKFSLLLINSCRREPESSWMEEEFEYVVYHQFFFFFVTFDLFVQIMSYNYHFRGIGEKQADSTWRDALEENE